MWQILKAEIRQNGIFLLVLYVLVLLPIIINVIQKWPTIDVDSVGIRSLMGFGLVAIIAFRLTMETKERRGRYCLLLPLSVLQIGISRLLFPLLVWLSLILLFFLGTSTARPYHFGLIIGDTLSMTGFMLMVNAISQIQKDLAGYFPGKYNKAVQAIQNSLIILLGYSLLYFLFSKPIPYFAFLRHLKPIHTDLSKVASSWIVILLFNLIGLGLTGLSSILFMRRKSYLE